MTKCILIIDDEEDIRDITQLGLEMSMGWRVLTASSGQKGIAIAAAEQPDAILLDVMMPDMDGRMTFAGLQANPQTQNIPVILVTAKIQASDQESFADLAVAGILTKPYRAMNVAEQICKILAWTA
ncbi:MAG: response regulator [Aphanocapsa sp. GSE-SYN-MK-11-07L]|jgi:CheY-like chemotaxis protein|nr:response regulator [Aphanocapsa sp. GSE-SYN-MK-11-07L]